MSATNEVTRAPATNEIKNYKIPSSGSETRSYKTPSSGSETRSYKIPKTCFDMEYATQWKKEVEYLYSKGIAPTFTKRDKEYGVVTYKYKKTKELFGALYDLYNEMYHAEASESLEELLKLVEDCKVRSNRNIVLLNVEDLKKLISCDELSETLFK